MKFIYIPQKCFGIITPKTDRDIGGLYTEGVFSCSGVVVRVISGNWSILCHADEQTDLEQGLRTWVHMIPPSSGKIIVEYDTTPDNSDEHIYTPQIQNAIRFLHGELRVIEPQLIYTRAEGVRIYRDGKVIRESCPSDALMSEEHHEIDDSSRDMSQYIGSIHEFLDKRRYLPICVFDGRGILTIDSIKAQHPNLASAFTTAEQPFTLAL